MSLLTQEQLAIVKQEKGLNLHAMHRTKRPTESAKSIRSLLAIIDDLQARAPRQYTEQELREWFENRPLVQDEIDALLHEVVPGENEAWYSVLKFAAHVGALKAEQ